MLRRSTTALVFIPAPGPAKWCGVPNNDNIEHLITLVKLSKKNRLHHGAYFHRIPDREYYYSQFGGPRGGRFTIRRSCSKKQYLHHTESQGKYDIHHTNPTQAWSGNGGPGGLFRNIWDSQCSGSNPFWDACFKVNGRNLEKDNAVQWMESWGVKYKVLDWRTQPKQYDMVYTKHRLYAHNFPWKKDPYTNAWKGDADWQWRGAEKIDYNVHGAGTASLANEFRSLWNLPEPFTKPRFPAAAAPKAAATPKPKVEAPKPKAEAPKAAAPKPAETPKAEAPKPEAPKAAAPKPAAEAPKAAEVPKPAAETPKKAAETVAPAAAAAAATPAAAEAPKPKTE